MTAPLAPDTSEAPRKAPRPGNPPQTGPWDNRIVGYGEEAPDQLLANPANWRIHPKAQQDALGAVLDRVGIVAGVTVNRRTGFMVDGHLRVELALSRGEPMVPVTYVDLSPEEEALVLASLDPLGSMAGTDSEKLQELLGEVALDNAALEAHLISFYSAGRKHTGDPEAVPEVPSESWVQPGDVWVLGDHRIMCGDSTKPEDVARLMDGHTATLMATDPPYLVNYTGGDHPASGNMNHKPASKDKHWDDYTDPETGVAFYVGFVEAARPHLVERVPIYQRLSRRCFAMELSPAFVQVAIERWQTFTGQEARRG